MRLTKLRKETIVRSVMADAPQKDYYEEEREVMERAVYKSAPKAIKAVLDDPEMHPYLGTTSVCSRLSNSHGHHRYYSFRGLLDKKTFLAESHLKLLDNIKEKHDAQKEKRANAESALERAIEPFATSRQLREAMPELAKYIPEDADKTKNLPAVANVMASLKAAGWKQPKAS